MLRAGIALVPERRRVFADLTVLETGRVVPEGTGAELLDHDELKAAYLGG